VVREVEGAFWSVGKEKDKVEGYVSQREKGEGENDLLRIDTQRNSASRG